MAIEEFTSKYSSSQIESMLDKVKQDMDTITYTQAEVQSLLNKINLLTLPTKLSELTNDTGFIINSVDNLINYYTKTQTYTKSEVNNLLSAIHTIQMMVVDELPTEDISTTTIYLVPKTTSRTKNKYDEYIYVYNEDDDEHTWELIGDTAVSLTNYVTNDALNTALQDYITNSGLQQVLTDYVTNTSLTTTLADYVTTSALNTALNNKQDKTLGTPITVDGQQEITVEGALNAINNKLTGTGNEESEIISKAEFDALTTAEKNNGKTYYIYDANIVQDFTVMGNRFDKANIYTTTERMIGSWMGKPLYQKTYMLTGLTQSSNTIAHGLTNLDTIVYCFGSIRKSTDGSINPLDHADNYGNQYCVYLNVTKTNIIIDAHGYSGYSYDTGNVTIQYTKTTDGTISIGTENDYSTDEQIIGTWLDGKPLYQKTTILTTEIILGSNTWVTISSLGDIEAIVCSIAYTKSNNNYMYYPVYTAVANGNFRFLQTRNSEMEVFAYTIQYTKTTD